MTSIEKIEELVQQELTEANAEHPQFHSDHEAWAVIKEEMDECEDEIDSAKKWMSAAWAEVKANEKIEYSLECIKCHAMALIQEAIQVAAMCEKGLARYEHDKKM